MNHEITVPFQAERVPRDFGLDPQCGAVERQPINGSSFMFLPFSLKSILKTIKEKKKRNTTLKKYDLVLTWLIIEPIPNYFEQDSGRILRRNVYSLTS